MVTMTVNSRGSMNWMKVAMPTHAHCNLILYSPSKTNKFLQKYTHWVPVKNGYDCCFYFGWIHLTKTQLVEASNDGFKDESF